MATSESVRDVLSKYIYFSLREYIITGINNEIKAVKSKNCIGILDMPGFGKFI